MLRHVVIFSLMLLCSESFAQRERMVRLRLLRDGEEVHIRSDSYFASMVVNGEEVLEGPFNDTLFIKEDVWPETYVKFRQFELDNPGVLIFTLRGPDFSVSTDVSSMVRWKHFNEPDQLITFWFMLYRSKVYYKNVNRRIIVQRGRKNPVCKSCPGSRKLPNNPIKAWVLATRVPLFEAYVEEEWTNSLSGNRVYNSYDAKIVQSDIRDTSLVY